LLRDDGPVDVGLITATDGLVDALNTIDAVLSERLPPPP
jgi:uncharacterized membrane protein